MAKIITLKIEIPHNMDFGGEQWGVYFHKGVGYTEDLSLREPFDRTPENYKITELETRDEIIIDPTTHLPLERVSVRVEMPPIDFTGVIRDIPFVKGIGYTSNSDLAKAFKECGYSVVGTSLTVMVKHPIKNYMGFVLNVPFINGVAYVTSPLLIKAFSNGGFSISTESTISQIKVPDQSYQGNSNIKFIDRVGYLYDAELIRIYRNMGFSINEENRNEAKIECPIKKFNGVYNEVTFVNGAGYTKDLWIIDSFKNSGFKVIEYINPKPTIDDSIFTMKSYLDVHKITYDDKATKADLLKLIEG